MAAENTIAKADSPLAKASSWTQSAKDYFEDLQKEMRLVTWPSRKQVIATTTVVVASVFLFAVYFFVVDLAFGRLIAEIFTRATGK
ncbi:MAG: preprotein translocase subunit SecE [Bryobacter sp.]|nr:preprotein translocase subunit SecE [Bryobacter sp.]